MITKKTLLPIAALLMLPLAGCTGGAQNTAAGVDDDVLLGYAAQDGSTWYVAAPVGENNVLSDTVGLWVTDGDVEADEFDGTWTSANDDADETSTFDRSSTADDDNDAAEQALSCIEDAGESVN